MSIEVMAFIGSSPIRMYAEEWDLPFLLDRSRQAIEFARREGLPVTFVTEDTTRSRPDILHRLFATAIEAGAQRICLCDTVGHSTPDGIRSLLRFIWNLLRGLGVEVGVDWHGHNDRGIALSNSLWALQWGADRLHGCALGVGERSGNCSLDRLIMNLRLLGTFGEERDLSGLLAYCECASRILHHPIAVNYPLAGRDAFRTQSGVHAAAILKARRKGETYLADRIYSGVPAGMFGRRQEVVIGPMSGASNVTQYCDARGIACDAKGIAAILDYAKAGTHILTEDEVRTVLRESRAP
jgi:2-isopropylmalate synthase